MLHCFYVSVKGVWPEMVHVKATGTNILDWTDSVDLSTIDIRVLRWCLEVFTFVVLLQVQYF